jgi:hypothetical protein
VLVRKDAFPLTLIVLLLGTLAGLRPRGGWREFARRTGPLAPSAAFGALLLVAYVSTVYAGWYYPRYFFPWLLPLPRGARHSIAWPENGSRHQSAPDHRTTCRSDSVV